MRIHRLRAWGCLTSLVLVLGMANFTPAMANAKDPDPLFSIDSYPHVGGVASAQPLALGFMRGFTKQDVDSADVVLGSEADAYEGLVSGASDLILAPGPSVDETAAAKQAGVELQATPVAQSRLVFLTGADNPVDSITSSQLRDIYSGAITDWSQVGGNPGPITAYQRMDGSGSQTGMLDLVMRGTAMMDPPTSDARWMGTLAQTVTNFEPSEGALGYAYSYYVQAIWPDLMSTGKADGVKVLKVGGVSPDPSVQNYPLTTTYDVIIRSDEPKNSPARTLADKMVDPQGQDIVRDAGYSPLDPVDPPEASEPAPNPASSNTSQTYTPNPVTVSTTVRYVTAESGDVEHCALVERPSIEGLADINLQNSLTAEFISRQDGFLMRMWGADQLVPTSSCTNNAVPDVVLRTFATADFANVLSLHSSWGVPGSPGAHDPAATLNVRLDTGQELSFADLFTPGTNIADLVQAEALSSDPYANEQDILSWIDDYRVHPDRSFSFSATSATLYLPGAANGEDTGITVGYSSHLDKVAVFTLASGASGLYATPTEPAAVDEAPPATSQQTVAKVDELVVEPADSVLTITSDPVKVVTDPCTGETTTTPDTFTAEVAVVDSYLNPIPEAVVAFSTTDGMMLTQQYVTADDHGVATIMAIMDQAALLRGAVPVLSATILVDGNQVPVAGSGIEVPVEISAPDKPITLPQATISSSPVPADNHSAYTVSVQWIDGCGVPVTDLPVQFSVDASAALSSGSVPLDDQGQAQVTVTDPVAESVGIQADVATGDGNLVGVKGLTPLVFSMATPDPVQASMDVDFDFVAIPCDAPGTATLTAMVKDASGHPLYRHNVNLSATGNAVLSDTTITTDLAGRATVSLSDDTPETVTVLAWLDSGQEITGSPVTMDFVSGCAPVSSQSMWFSVSQGPKLADGQDAYTVTVYAKDVNGGPVTGLADQLEVSESSGAVTVGEVTDNSDGTYTAQLTSSQAGTFSVRVTTSSGDGHRRDLSNSPASLTFIPVWEPTLSVSLKADGQQSYLVTAQISARMGKSSPAPLAGQAPQMSVEVLDSDSTPTNDVQVGDFNESQPGVYTATATSSAPGEYDVVVSWTENGTGQVASTGAPMTFLNSGGTAVSVSTGGHQISPDYRIWILAVALTSAGAACGILRGKKFL